MLANAAAPTPAVHRQKNCRLVSASNSAALLARGT